MSKRPTVETNGNSKPPPKGPKPPITRTSK